MRTIAVERNSAYTIKGPVAEKRSSQEYGELTNFQATTLKDIKSKSVDIIKYRKTANLYSEKSTRAVVLLDVAFQYPKASLRALKIFIIGWKQTLHHGGMWWKRATSLHNRGKPSKRTSEAPQYHHALEYSTHLWRCKPWMAGKILVH